MFLLKRRNLLALSLLLFCLCCFGQVKEQAFRVMLQGLLKHSVPEISVSSAAASTSKTVFLDAREPEEYDVSHLKGAIPVGYDHFDAQKLDKIPKNQKIIVYCSVGYRSEKIAEKLVEAGYTNVSNLYGGIFEWVNQGRPIVNVLGSTRQVHAFDREWGVWLRKGDKVY